MRIDKVEQLEKGKVALTFDNGNRMVFYKGELKPLFPEEGLELSETEYEALAKKLQIRVKKRAVFLLEKQDRTEAQIRRKLKENSYPEEMIDEAVFYLKERHFLDDRRYAENYIRYHCAKESKGKLRLKLMEKGVSKEIIEAAMEEEYVGDEDAYIKMWLQKKNFSYEESDQKEKQKIYGFLIRKGFQSADILRVMKCSEYLT